MGGPIETELAGDPAAFHAVADYLRDALASRTEALADETAAQRAALATAWLGAAGQAFGRSARGLVEAADGLSTEAEAAAAQIASLGDTLQQVLDELAQVRLTALADGLRVEGTTILWPQSPIERIRSDLLETNAILVVWNKAADSADACRRRWYDAVNRTAQFLADHAATIAGWVLDLVTATVPSGLLLRLSRVMSAEAAFRLAEAERLEGLARQLATKIELFGDPQDKRYFEHLMDMSFQARRASESSWVLADRPKLPPAIKGGVGALNVVAGGIGVYADIQEGESTAQALTSQGAGLAAGFAATAGTGAMVGSVLPGPGTVAGAVTAVGIDLVVGTGMAFLADHAVDWLWEHGDDDPHPDHDPAQDDGAVALGYATAVISPQRGGAR